ncbi:MAG: GNAT family N-acetyltransferase [Ferruginibacter sp.]|nr:GNAT family N-acetyltransferase [Ferruginibacter sp.]
MNIEIKKIAGNDVAILSAIAKETFYDTFKDTCTIEDMQNFLQNNYNEEALSLELKNENYHYYFACIDDKPIGYLLFAEDYGHWPKTERKKALELKRIYILQNYQGKGVAQALMDFYLNYATTNSYEVAWLGVWEHNEKAKAFYAKYGFENSGFTHNFPIGSTPQTDVWLWKFL